MKVLVLTALDGSKWNVPVAVVEKSFYAHYGEDEGYPGDDEITDWAQNNMNWADVKSHATKVKGADPLNMDDSWANGDMEVIDLAPPRPAAGFPAMLAASPTFTPSIVFNGPENKALVTVKPTGEVEIAEGVTLTEAARTFWAGVEKIGVNRARQHNPDYVAGKLSATELIGAYNTMDGAAIIAKVEVGSHGDAILEAFARKAIRLAVEKVAAEVSL